MLLAPRIGFVWAEVPWNGTDGSVAGNYLVVVPKDNKPSSCEKSGTEPVLYLGTTAQSIVSSTPGSQVVLAWGKKMTVDPGSWRNINLHI